MKNHKGWEINYESEKRINTKYKNLKAFKKLIILVLAKVFIIWISTSEKLMSCMQQQGTCSRSRMISNNQ